MAGGFGAPSFTGTYGGRFGGGSTPSYQTGGPDYGVSSMAGGTGGEAPQEAPTQDEVSAGFLGQPLTWWFVIVLLLVGMSLLGGRR